MNVVAGGVGRGERADPRGVLYELLLVLQDLDVVHGLGIGSCNTIGADERAYIGGASGSESASPWGVNRRLNLVLRGLNLVHRFSDGDTVTTSKGQNIGGVDGGRIAGPWSLFRGLNLVLRGLDVIQCFSSSITIFTGDGVLGCCNFSCFKAVISCDSSGGVVTSSGFFYKNDIVGSFLSLGGFLC